MKLDSRHAIVMRRKLTHRRENTDVDAKVNPIERGDLGTFDGEFGGLKTITRTTLISKTMNQSFQLRLRSMLTEDLPFSLLASVQGMGLSDGARWPPCSSEEFICPINQRNSGWECLVKSRH
jgi:hypothetical protein